MQSRIVLISEDADFFEYISQKFKLRKNDELYRFKFEELPDKLHLLSTSVLIINSEGAEDKTLELLSLTADNPVIVFAYNEYEKFKQHVLKNGANAYITPLTNDEELHSAIISALKISSIFEKNKQYREILVRKNLIMPNNEVLLDYNSILDRELEKLNETSSMAVLAAISPDDKTKFLLQPNQIETIILNNIRKNDILMNYAVNKYFLLLYDIDVENAEKIWTKIQNCISEKVYAGFAKTFSKSRVQLVNEALNKLHEAISCNKIYTSMTRAEDVPENNNFKQFKLDFYKNFEKIVNPVFYHIRQKYSDKLFGITLEQDISDTNCVFQLKGKHASAAFKMSCPGFSKINIDITFQEAADNIDAKRISLNPEELEAGLLEDLLEQFIIEFKEKKEY